MILFVPFFSFEFLENYGATIGLWFSNFEFNASIYYFVKWVLDEINGVNLINSTGAIVAFVLAIHTSYQLLQKKQGTKALLLMIFWVLSGYYFISTTVHPWYITSLLLLSIYTNYRFILVWSYTLIFSYCAYSEFSVKESSLLLSLEYMPVFAMLIWELYSMKMQKVKASLNY